MPPITAKGKMRSVFRVALFAMPPRLTFRQTPAKGLFIGRQLTGVWFVAFDALNWVEGCRSIDVDKPEEVASDTC